MSKFVVISCNFLWWARWHLLVRTVGAELLRRHGGDVSAYRKKGIDLESLERWAGELEQLPNG